MHDRFGILRQRWNTVFVNAMVAFLFFCDDSFLLETVLNLPLAHLGILTNNKGVADVDKNDI